MHATQYQQGYLLLREATNCITDYITLHIGAYEANPSFE